MPVKRSGTRLGVIHFLACNSIAALENKILVKTSALILIVPEKGEGV
jgi:hypothetical protein